MCVSMSLKSKRKIPLLFVIFKKQNKNAYRYTRTQATRIATCRTFPCRCPCPCRTKVLCGCTRLRVPALTTHTVWKVRIRTTHSDVQYQIEVLIKRGILGTTLPWIVQTRIFVPSTRIPETRFVEFDRQDRIVNGVNVPVCVCVNVSVWISEERCVST